MAAAAEPEVPDGGFSLLSLEDELTCSVCLSTFDCPVTLPCGHNFCQGCLDATWKGAFTCPQCRTYYATRPELKKNTVLGALVEALKGRAMGPKSGGGGSCGGPPKEKEEEESCSPKKAEVIRCDTCMEAEAAQTCLTCMASYCDEHLRPHRENPVFRVHQLSEPLGDLQQRICPQHHKLMELFCCQHGCLICAHCVHQGHKDCSLRSSVEQKALQEFDLKQKLGLMDQKIMQNKDIMSKMMDMQNNLMDAATEKKRAVAREYQLMRDMLVKDESDAMNVVERELEGCQTRLGYLLMKFSENIDSLKKAKDDISGLLSDSQALAFLQTSFKVPQAATFDPHAPRINLDTKKVTVVHTFAVSLKEHLEELFQKPIAARTQALKKETNNDVPPDGATAPASGCPPGQNQDPGLAGQTPTPTPVKATKKKKQPKNTPQTSESGGENEAHSLEFELEFGGKDKPGAQPYPAKPAAKPAVESTDVPPSITTAEKRSELLKYAVALVFDHKTVHKRIHLSENFTKATVSDDPTNYPEHPERFAVCSQVLSTKGFAKGRQYWEVRMSSSNFIGLGLAYKNIDRKGPTSRLGRNPHSWCVEWFNVKLSAWHNSNEIVLVNPNPKRVGVLLDRDAGTVTFYNVADRAYPFHTFVFNFTKPVYPAFWMFLNGSHISLCKLQP